MIQKKTFFLQFYKVQNKLIKLMQTNIHFSKCKTSIITFLTSGTYLKTTAKLSFFARSSFSLGDCCDLSKIILRI